MAAEEGARGTKLNVDRKVYGNDRWECVAGGGREAADVSKMEKKWKKIVAKSEERRSEKEKKGKKGCCWLIGATNTPPYLKGTNCVFTYSLSSH